MSTDDEQPTEVLAPGALAAPTAPAAAAALPARPTIRWGALVWALLFAAAAAGLTLWVLTSGDRRDATAAAIMGLDPVIAALYVVVALGVVVALFGLVGLIRRGERARRSASG